MEYFIQGWDVGLIHVIIYSQKAEDIDVVKKHIDMCCGDMDYTYLSFEYPMDVLDYLNASHPERCAVFYITDNYDEGIEIAGKVNEINPRYRFNLFCNTYDDAEKLFYSGVTYYVKTPCSTDGMLRCSSFLKKYYEEKSRKCIQLKSKNGMENVMLSDVDYVMSDKRKVIIKARNMERTFYYKLDEIENLMGEGFLRCHQSYIVNMTRIRQFVEDGIILSDETFVPASRKRYYASKKAYLAYITGNKAI